MKNAQMHILGSIYLIITFLTSSCAANPGFQATATAISPSLTAEVTATSNPSLPPTAAPSETPTPDSTSTSTAAPTVSHSPYPSLTPIFSPTGFQTGATEQSMTTSQTPLSEPTSHTESASNPVLYFYDSSNSMYGYVYPLNDPTFRSTHVLVTNNRNWHGISFSHYSNQLAHFSTKAHTRLGLPAVWISDFAITADSKILSHENYIYSRIDWTPDDLHIIIHLEEKEDESIIYHLRTGTAEPWPYHCNQIAVSPKTGQFALWCLSTQENNVYKVIEWRGEIWDSPESPDSIVVETNSKIDNVPEQWGWSPDGKRIAYFDPDGSLMVASADGTSLMVLPGAIACSAEEITTAYNRPIQWSANGERILIFAEGSDERPCPPDKETFSDFAVPDPEPPCWQVYDAATGEVVWHLSDYTESDSQFYWSAGISPNGRTITLSFRNLGDASFFVIDLNSGEVVWGSVFYADDLRWADAPKTP